MRKLGAALAILSGLVLWAIVALLSDGLYPLGIAGPREKWLFAMPLALFAAPLLALALARRRPLTALWIAALAPLAGFLNGLLAVGLMIAHHPLHESGQLPALLAGLWLALTLLVLLVARLRRRSARNAPARAADAPSAPLG